MKVLSAVFAGGSSEPGRWPSFALPEVAIAGRSNVGKSSAINLLLVRRGLARTSSTPGRTRQLNFFLVNEALVVADLPGYGWARVSKEARAAWRPLVESYLTGRSTLRGVLLLVDVRRGLEDEERQLLAFLAAHDIPARLVATKIDKIRRGARPQALAPLAAVDPAVVSFSATAREGRDAVWRTIAAWTVPARRRG